MRLSETPEGWQKEPKEQNEETEAGGFAQASLIAKVGGVLLLLVMLGGGIAGYIFIARDSSLAGSVPLPKAFETKSPANDDLMKLGQDIDQAATDAQQRLAFHDSAARAAAVKLRARMNTLRANGRKLEPKLTRDETRTIMAFEAAEEIINEYIDACEQGDQDDTQLDLAKKQLESGLKVARGEQVDKLILGRVKRKVAATEGVKDLNEVIKASHSLGGALNPGGE